ncbi:MAG: ABC transporter ATP-binding protein, partial [Desulfobacterales bacterium]|nr:ABC transporter ATP-binding protein [Desulfobacterales bacterium]
MTAKNQPEVLLNVEDLLVRRGGVTVLDISGLEVFQGQVLSLIGPNGAGKSTLMLTLAGLLKPARGSLFFRGERIADGGFAYRRHIAMVFQEPLLFDTTVFENVAAGLKIRGVGRSEIGRTVPEYLERFGIGHLAKRSARKLSGGEAQRTSLARAFVTEPEIIFLDEPFSALDPPTREALTGDLERVLRETHTTAVATTHDQTEALRLGDRIAVLNGGKIAQIGPAAEVINRPVDEFVASFVGVETVLPGRVVRISDGVFTASVQGGEIEAVGRVRMGDEVLCCIRPE